MTRICTSRLRPRYWPVVVIVFLAVLPAAMTEMRAQQRRDRPPRPTLHVASMADLEAKTEEERALARYFKEMFPLIADGARGPHKGPKFTEVPISVPESPGAQPLAPAIPTEMDLVPFVCWVDETAFGRVLSERIIVSADHTALITVYRVRVDRWVRPGSGPAEMTVGVEGGHVAIGGESYTVDKEVSLSTDFPYLVQTRSGPAGTHLLEGGYPASDDRLSFANLSGPIANVLNTVSTAVSKCQR